MKKLLAEFLGVLLFLTAIVAATSSPFHTAALATVLGLAILVTAGYSGGHLNPAVSLFFYSRKEMSLTDLIGYVIAQIAGAFVGVWLGNTLTGSSISAIANTNNATTAGVIGEIVATGGLVWLVGRLATNKQGSLIPVAVGLWVFAAANFTATGAQANPAVTIGLLLNGQGLGTAGALLLAEIAGLLLAVIFLMAFNGGAPAKKAAAPAAAAKPAVAKKPAARKPAAKKPAARKPAAKK